MKTFLNKLVALLAISIVVSCSSSSDNPAGSQDNSALTNYLPLHSGNYWTYNVHSQGTVSRDSLYVANDTLINSISYKKMKTLAVPTGFFSTTLRNNGLRTDGNMLKLSGKISLNLGLAAPLEFTTNDFIIFKENAITGDALSSSSGTFTQDVQSGTSTIPLTFTYTLSSVSDGSLSTYTSVDGTVSTTYTDVKKTKVVLNLKITTTQTIPGFPNPITINIMDPQDVVTSIQYYAKDKGMAYTNTHITYHLNSIPGVTLPIPSTGDQTQEEYLHTHVAN